MIRVAIIAGVLHTGGKRNLIMEYYRHIDREKVQFDFLCLQNSNGIQDDEITSLGGRVYRLPSYKMLFANLWQTYRILKRNNYQVMHAFDNTLNVFPLFAGKLAGVPLRISESVSKGNKREFKTMAKYVLRLFSRCFATHYFANSTESAVWQFGKNVFEEGQVTIFSSVINADNHSFCQGLRDETRIRFGWKEKVVYGFIGRFVQQKNPIFLLEIFSEIHRRQKDAVFGLVGYGPLEEKMKQKVKSYGLENYVMFFGRRDDVRRFYNAFDALLLPSLYEGMPIVGLEAQCCGLPVFFSDNVTYETSATEQAHFLSLKESPADWADIIISVVSANKGTRRSYVEEMKKAGFDSYEEAIRLQEFYQKHVELL